MPIILWIQNRLYLVLIVENVVVTILLEREEDGNDTQNNSNAVNQILKSGFYI